MNLSVTETDFVVVEDLTNAESSAVVLKGTLVLNFRSPPRIKGPCDSLIVHSTSFDAVGTNIADVSVCCGCGYSSHRPKHA